MMKAAHSDETQDSERQSVEPIMTYKEEHALRQQTPRAAKLATGHSACGTRMLEAASGLRSLRTPSSNATEATQPTVIRS